MLGSVTLTTMLSSMQVNYLLWRLLTNLPPICSTDIQTQSQCLLNPNQPPALPTMNLWPGPSNQPEATCFLAAAPEESLTAPCLRQLDSKPYLFFIWLHCAACGILVPRPGIELMLPGAEAQSPDHWTKGISRTQNLEEVEGGEVGCSASSSSILSQSTAFFFNCSIIALQCHVETNPTLSYFLLCIDFLW